uniref:methyltransferase n=1 Tax=Streptomyces hawaiiensis TaxID=67305 RepID=UPI0031D3DF48
MRGGSEVNSGNYRTLLDLEAPAAAAERDFAAAGLRERCRAVVGSFFDPLPADGDVCLLSDVLLNWPDDREAEILGRCADAVRPGGRVMVLEGLLDLGPMRSLVELTRA